MTEERTSEISEQRRSEYLRLMEIHNTNRIDYNVRKWETLKFFQSIALAFIGGTIVALTAGVDHNIFCKAAWIATPFTCAIATLPVIAGSAAILAILNLRRETALLFAEEAQSFKLAKFLELDVEIPPSQRWIHGDNRLLMPKWRLSVPDSSTSDDNLNFRGWIAMRLKTHRFQLMSTFLFGLEAAISVVLLGCIIAIYLATQASLLHAARFC